MISVIVYGRNDSHGYNLPKRAALSFNCIAEVLTHPDDEIIFVDCNTPDDMPTFPESIADTLTQKSKQILRIIRVRPEQYERGKNGAKFKVLEPLCRNIAIRRSNPKNRWILNTNTDMVFVPLKGGSLSDVCASLADGFYELPRFEVPEMLWESTDRKDPEGIIKAFHRWGTRLHLNEVVKNNAETLFDGPGDFQLALRKQMFGIYGMNEQMVLGWHVDSNLCKRLFLVNGKTDHILDKVYAYHCDHTRLNSVYHNTQDSTSNDLNKFFDNVLKPEVPEQASNWGMPSEQFEEFRLTDEPAARYIRVMEKLLPDMKVSMLSSGLNVDAWNHGLLYSVRHVLPYLADHLSVIPPHLNIGYIGANIDLVVGVAQFRRLFGHTGKILINEQFLRLGAGIPDRLVDSCEFVSIDSVYQDSGIMCFDLWQGNFPKTTNQGGYTVPAAGMDHGRYAAALIRVLMDFARREKSNFHGKATAPRKFLFIGTQNTWFESATVQLFSMVMTPYSTYVRHGLIRSDAFERPWLPLHIDHLISKPNVDDQAAALSREIGRPVGIGDFLFAQLFATELSLGSPEDFLSAPVIASLVADNLLYATLERKQLEFEASGQLERADRLHEIQNNWSELLPKLRGQFCRKQRPLRIIPQNCRRVLVDALTFFSRDSMERGIGNYTRHHVLGLAKAAPEINFVLTSKHGSLPDGLNELLSMPNISYRIDSDCRSEDFDLYFIPDPMTIPAGPDSSLDAFPELPLCAVFYDLTPLRIYFPRISETQRIQYLERLLTLKLRRATLLTISDFTREDLIRAELFSPQQIYTIYAGLSIVPKSSSNTFSDDRSILLKFGITKPFFLHVGAIDPHKNFAGVISALRLTGKTDVFQLVVVGRKNGDMAVTENYLKETELKNVIIFTDFIPREDLEVLYLYAHGLICMSHYEGFGFPVLEAMAQGCPVICSNTTSLPEVAGDAALKFSPNDHRGVAKAMNGLFEDSKLRGIMQTRGLVQAGKFSWSRSADLTLGVWASRLTNPIKY